MLRNTNPFKPTFGSMPFAFAGRTELIDDVIGGLVNAPGDPNRSTIFIGPRGSGKTVLLNTIAREAAEQGWISVSVSARKGLYHELFDGIRTNAKHLPVPEKDSALTALQVGPLSIEREFVERESLSYRFQLQGILEDLNSKGIGLLVLIDEIDPTCEELIDYIDTYQHFVSEERDVALLMAGLPGQVSSLLLDKHVSFIRRAFQRWMNPIPRLEVEEALFSTIAANGKRIDADALEYAARATTGFALAIQLVGYFLWRESYGRDSINMDDANEAVTRMRKELISAVVAPTVQALTQREQDYLSAMAQDDGPSSTSDIAQRMGISMTNASNLRRRLIEHGVIGTVRMGTVAFTMPGMREYLREGITQADLEDFF